MYFLLNMGIFQPAMLVSLPEGTNQFMGIFQGMEYHPSNDYPQETSPAKIFSGLSRDNLFQKVPAVFVFPGSRGRVW